MSKPSDNPQANHSSSLLKHRKRRWRPLSSNPFVKVEPITVEGGETANLPALSHRPTELGDDQPSEKQDLTRGTPLEVPRSSERHDVAWERPPEWLDLLYDLAWTASFSSLTSNTEFKSPGDTVSYIAFFTAMWWIWTSQVFYAIDFYMDDWFHLICIFFHVIIFGLLATFTRGLDVFTYILHSPGSPTWESYDDDTITPELYAARRLTKKSFEFVAIVVAVSRVLLLVQHIIGAFMPRLSP
ncbi:hypothetical protein FRC12_006640 [Ceratobasidium sp. 428]|nr:hypothetical protein FRC12_006640 [Ceratobasidium sp. 428]